MDQSSEVDWPVLLVQFSTACEGCFSWKMLRREVQPLLKAFVDSREDSPNYLTVDGNFYVPNYDNKLRSVATSA